MAAKQNTAPNRDTSTAQAVVGPETLRGEQAAPSVRFLLETAAGIITLPEGSIYVGRGVGCEIAVDDPKVSRRHARITVAGSILSVEDLDSINGTFVDGERIEGTARLGIGQNVRVGPVEMTVHVRLGRGEEPQSGVRESHPDSSRL